MNNLTPQQREMRQRALAEFAQWQAEAREREAARTRDETNDVIATVAERK